MTHPHNTIAYQHLDRSHGNALDRIEQLEAAVKASQDEIADLKDALREMGAGCKRCDRTTFTRSGTRCVCWKSEARKRRGNDVGISDPPRHGRRRK